MAISLYTGLPGHGKSYGVVENVIIPALKKNRKVFSNIPMREDECIKQFGLTTIMFETGDIKDNPNWWSEVFEKGSLFVLDEVAMLWPAGLKANNLRDSDKEFLSQHRHMVSSDGFSTEIVLMVQKPSHIAAYVRGLVESTFWTKKLIAIGSSTKYRIDIYSGCSMGDNPIVDKRDREIYGSFKKEVYSLYVSQTMSDSESIGDERRVDSRFNVLKGYGIKFGFVVFILALFLVAYLFQDLKKGYGFGEDDNTKAKLTKESDGQSLEPSISKLPLKEVKHQSDKARKFLSSVDSITFTHKMTIQTQGQKVSKSYFKVVKGDTEATISDSELKLLGYAIKTISECIFFIEGGGFSEFVFCGKREEPKGFFQDLTTPPST